MEILEHFFAALLRSESAALVFISFTPTLVAIFMVIKLIVTPALGAVKDLLDRTEALLDEIQEVRVALGKVYEQNKQVRETICTIKEEMREIRRMCFTVHHRQSPAGGDKL